MVAAAGRPVNLLGHQVRVILPNRRDVRLRLSAVIISLQVLGQTVLNFKLSVAQILVSIGACALIEVALTAWRQRVLLWPASAILTGNGVAFILRANGTRHGDWWSLNGIHLFLLAAAVAMLSKYLVRPSGRHVYNPSNIGLVACLLVVGAGSVFPQYLWWGPLGAPVGAALAIIVVGAFVVLRPVRMWPMALCFLVPFAVAIAGLAATGHTFIASWHSGAIGGAEYWLDICTSPELFIFVFFMMSDPRTAPATPAARMAYGAATAVVACGFIAFQPTEYGIKVAILASLTLVCAFVPALEALTAHLARRRGGASAARPRSEPRASLLQRAGALLTPAVAAVVLITIAVPVAVVQLQSDQQVLDIERGPALHGAPSIQ